MNVWTASELASEVLDRGAVLIAALLELHPTVTPVEFAWLIRDLRRERELVSALESAPPTPWHEAARAIADGNLLQGVELVTRIGAPSVTAYTRLRTSEEPVRAGRMAEAREHLKRALAFFAEAGAARHLARTRGLLADGS